MWPQKLGTKYIGEIANSQISTQLKLTVSQNLLRHNPVPYARRKCNYYEYYVNVPQNNTPWLLVNVIQSDFMSTLSHSQKSNKFGGCHKMIALQATCSSDDTYSTNTGQSYIINRNWGSLMSLSCKLAAYCIYRRCKTICKIKWLLANKPNQISRENNIFYWFLIGSNSL